MASSYLQWNDAITSHFFRPEMAGKSVYLYVTEELIRELARSAGDDVRSFINAVKVGPPFATREGLCRRALQVSERWRERDLRLPPYVGYLALFVLAAGAEGEFAAHAYYPRLHQLASLPGEGMPPDFDHMLALWDDLERWSTRDKAGELGVFIVRRSGKRVNVGLPLGQTVLVEQERRSLPSIFAKANLDPTSPLSDEALAHEIRIHGAGALRQKTLQRIARQRDEELFPVLMDVISDELASWNGQIDPAPETGANVRVFGALRLCMGIDATAGRARAVLRCRLQRPFPDGGLLLTALDRRAPLHCDEDLPGWSSPLVEDDGSPLDASSVNWERGIALIDDRLGWRVQLPGAEVRLLAGGSAEGLPDLIEIHRVPATGRTYLLFHQAAWADLREWSLRGCEGFRDLDIRSGLRTGWRLATIDRVLNDHGVGKRFPVLALSDTVRVRFARGIRSSPGNNFFAFALPDVDVVGAHDNDEVRSGNTMLRRESRTGMYPLPVSVRNETRVGVEVMRSGEVIRTQSLYVTADFDWRWAGSRASFDRWGRVSGEALPSVAGALTEGIEASTFRPYPLLVRELQSAQHPIVFVGSRTGDVFSWPSDDLPRDWDPVWAIVGRKRMKAIFCAPAIDDSEPTVDASRSRRQRELWKNVLWHHRKRIRPPQHSELRALWNRYRLVARDA